jgi:hypothetical protein
VLSFLELWSGHTFLIALEQCDFLVRVNMCIVPCQALPKHWG